METSLLNCLLVNIRNFSIATFWILSLVIYLICGKSFHLNLNYTDILIHFFMSINRIVDCNQFYAKGTKIFRLP